MSNKKTTQNCNRPKKKNSYVKSQHSEVTLNYQLEHFGCMTWTKCIINKSAFAETKFCLYCYNLKNAAAFLQRKYFPKVTCHEWKWSCCQTSCEDLNLHLHVRLQTVQPAVLTPSPLNPANIPLLLPRTCATFGSAQIYAVFAWRRALQRNYSQITEDEEKIKSQI